MPLLKRLLFVDDEPSIRVTLPALLRRYGFQVTAVATVAQALNEIQNQEFDLLLCDLNVERENDGFDVVRAMREAYPHSVVVILTGYPALASAIEGIRLSVDGYLVKPSSADELVALLADKLAARNKPSAP
jgi:two-component system, NtrC family, response regulator HydG